MAGKGYIMHTVQVGDSLQRLATKYNVNDWRDIVRANNLIYPYLDDRLESAAPHVDEYKGVVAKVGTRLLIPSQSFNIPPVTTKPTDGTMEKLAYGSDLDIFSYNPENEKAVRLDDYGELTNKAGDLRLAEGVRNLRQSLIIRFHTSLGAMTLHPNFGSRLKKLVGLRGTPQNLIKMQLEAERTILSDFRVKRIKSLSIKKTGIGEATIEAHIVPIPPLPEFVLSDTITTN